MKPSHKWIHVGRRKKNWNCFKKEIRHPYEVRLIQELNEGDPDAPCNFVMEIAVFSMKFFAE